MPLDCHEARKEGIYWTIYGLDKWKRIEANHTVEALPEAWRDYFLQRLTKLTDSAAVSET